MLAGAIYRQRKKYYEKIIARNPKQAVFRSGWMRRAVGLAEWFFGGVDGFFKVLITCTVINYITGVCRAGFEGKISSIIGFKGIARKVIMFFLVGIANIIDEHLLGDKTAFRVAVILFYNRQ